MGSDKHLVIAAAGTGGHVMPGLAVAAEMIARGWEVSWLGTEAGMEKMLVSKKGIEFDAVDFSGVRGHGLAGAVSGAVKLAKAFPAAKAILQKRRATAFFSTGGYIAVPSAIAAHRMGIPAVVQLGDGAAAMAVGRRAILDADNGTLVVEPDGAQIARVDCQIALSRLHGQQPDPVAALPCLTKGGTAFRLMQTCNLIDNEVPHTQGAAGIGIVRSESADPDEPPEGISALGRGRPRGAAHLRHPRR